MIICSSSVLIFFHWNSLTYLLTELSPSWEAANCAATHELHRILWRPKVHYLVHKNPSLVPILSQINPIYTIPSYLPKIHFNMVYTPTFWSSQWSLFFLVFPPISYMHSSSPPFLLHAPPTSSFFNLIILIILEKSTIYEARKFPRILN
jgi:hypothetical protein